MFDNKNVLFGVVLFTVLIALGMLKAGTDISNHNTLDSDSADYLTHYNSLYSNNGLTDFKEDAEAVNKTSNPLLDKLSNLPVISDFLGALNFMIDATTGIWKYIVFIFNIPSFLIESLGMDLGAFKIYLDVIIYSMSVGLLYFLVRSVK